MPELTAEYKWQEITAVFSNTMGDFWLYPESTSGWDEHLHSNLLPLFSNTGLNVCQMSLAYTTTNQTHLGSFL
jgi:hypothetical protein